jgi:hypothetical protein
MLLKYQYFLIIFLLSFLVGFTSLADEISGNLGNSIESGLSGVVKNCSQLSTTNGSVEAYPSCIIKCNQGYSLSGSSCIQIPNVGGGGGGNPNISITNSTINNNLLSTSSTLIIKDILNEGGNSSKASSTISGNDIILEKILTESQVVGSKNKQIILDHVGFEVNIEKEEEASLKFKEILSLDKNILVIDKKTVNDFIVYGTKSTQRLGSGERAAVVNSYYKAYKKIADSEGEWSDILKIASGRWPTERSDYMENQAKLEFKKVYHRAANMKNNIDENAIMVITYGLLPLNRNLDSEKVAIKSFEYIYGHKPINALAWNIVRAIGYSGAKR